MRTLMLIVLLPLSACGNDAKKEPPSASTATVTETAKPSSAEAQVTIDWSEREIETIEKELADGVPRLSSCAAAMANVDPLRAADAKLADRMTRLCTYDVPVAILAKGVPLAEAARAKDPDKLSMPECEPELALVARDFPDAALDDKVRDLIARMDKACPLLAKVRQKKPAQ